MKRDYKSNDGKLLVDKVLTRERGNHFASAGEKWRKEKRREISFSSAQNILRILLLSIHIFLKLIYISSSSLLTNDEL